jgi:hypothetical protein
MRNELEKIEGERRRFRAVVADFGVGRSAKRKETILLVEVRRTDDLATVVADHLWLKKGARFQEVSLGDVIEFDAQVARYEKGYQNFRLGIDETTVDYRLSDLSDVRIIAKVDLKQTPE